MIMIIETDEFTVNDFAILNKTLTAAYESVECEGQRCDNCDRYNACKVLRRLHDWAQDKEIWKRSEG